MDKDANFSSKILSIFFLEFFKFFTNLCKVLVGTFAIRGIYNEILSKLFKAQISFYDLNTREKLAGYLTNEIENIDTTVWQSLQNIVQPCVTALITIMLAIHHAPLLGPIALAVVSLNYYYYSYTHNFRISLARLEN